MTKITPVKRINIVSIKMVKERSILYDVRQITTPSDAAGLGRKFLEESDREQVIVCCLDTKNRPVSLNVVSIGCLNSSLIHPRETFKAAILSNAAEFIHLVIQSLPRTTSTSLHDLKKLGKSLVLNFWII